MIENEETIQHTNKADQFLQKVLHKKVNPISRSDSPIRIRWRQLSPEEYKEKQKNLPKKFNRIMKTKKITKLEGRKPNSELKNNKQRKFVNKGRNENIVIKIALKRDTEAC